MLVLWLLHHNFNDICEGVWRHWLFGWLELSSRMTSFSYILSVWGDNRPLFYCKLLIFSLLLNVPKVHAAKEIKYKDYRYISYRCWTRLSKLFPSRNGQPAIGFIHWSKELTRASWIVPKFLRVLWNVFTFFNFLLPCDRAQFFEERFSALLRGTGRSHLRCRK